MIARSHLARAAVALAAVLGCSPGSGSPPVAQQPVELPDSVEYVARGNEPFWAVSVSRDEVTWREPDRPEGLRGPLQATSRDGSRLVFRAVVGDSMGAPLELTLEETPCQDGMSGKVFDYSAVARFGGRELTGCAERRRIAMPGVDPQAVAQLGQWVVVAHRMSGVSAMSAAEADAWQGRVVRYEVDVAQFGADSCQEPQYRFRVVGVDSLLAATYHVTPAALGWTGGTGATLTLIQVHCGSAPWASPGGTLLQLADGRTFTVWDGTFFELHRREG
jgi:uncharacterized membrane protein